MHKHIYIFLNICTINEPKQNIKWPKAHQKSIKDIKHGYKHQGHVCIYIYALVRITCNMYISLRLCVVSTQVCLQKTFPPCISHWVALAPHVSLWTGNGRVWNWTSDGSQLILCVRMSWKEVLLVLRLQSLERERSMHKHISSLKQHIFLPLRKKEKHRTRRFPCFKWHPDLITVSGLSDP